MNYKLTIIVAGIVITAVFVMPGKSFDYRAVLPAPIVIKATITKYILPGVMASGREVYLSAIACPRAIKLGTRVAIDGVQYVCEDRLARQYDARFDIWSPDLIDALTWGIKNKEVLIYEK